MYVWAYYLSIVLLFFSFLFMIPIRLKNKMLHRIRTSVIIATIMSLFITFTPQEAIEGAPLHKFGDGKIAYLACSYQISLTMATFCPSDEESFYESDCFCSNPNARATISYCYSLAHPNSIDAYINSCKTDFHYNLTREDFDESLANYSKYAKPLSDFDDFKHGQLVDFPVKLSDAEVLLFKDAYDQFLGNYDRSIDYGFYLILYWVAVFTIAGLVNWSKVVFPGLHKRLTDPFSNWFRKNISTPATRGKKKTDEKKFFYFLNMLVPTRLETIILSGFLALSVYFTFINIHYVEGDPVFKHKAKALLRYYAVRCSILTSSMMPLLILFGGRNNVLQGLTRWDYSTFITFHRWISRIVVVMVVAHSVLYTKYAHHRADFFRRDYIIYGTIGTLSGIFIMIQGLLVLRRKYYETFLLLHIILALGFIFGAYFHVVDLYCLWFYHMTFGVWMFDRVVRIARLWSFGFPKAKVLLLADEALKVVVPKPSHWEAISGGHVFIHFLRPSSFWQSHPFTYTISTENPDEIIIFMKVKEGVTLDLYNYLHSHVGKAAEIRVAVEGSYGESTPAGKYDSAVFVAGGNGIPGIYAEAFELQKRQAHSLKSKVQLIWVIREYRTLFWFYEELLSLKNTSIETTIYVTKPDCLDHLEEFDLRFPEQIADEHTSLLSQKTYGSIENEGITSTNTNELNDNETNEIIRKIKEELNFVTFRYGRPSMDQIVKTSIKESTGSVAYITCGHPVMVDDLRHSVVCNIGNSERKRIDYYEQLQVWA
ncbi:ferric/cupric reductase transmembrane component 1 [[Candida] jaroonii]|uniref:Ferric/cupric reductase transmembrane component 1 n=1 Tax=[Candida] jaroonii TaxID=467808 RepID=A0ACA9Y383_9ASCO|nr:ferric/cupric reductase transmembrane component 1 [[Candida] jaroonii]